MDTQQLVDTITPEAYERLLYATETGRWPEGTVLSEQQRDFCIQAVMLYQSKHNIQPQHMTVSAGGEICFKSKSELKQTFSSGQEIARIKPQDGAE
jgi:uncharacterized protein YeaC (DUF1315 family)